MKNVALVLVVGLWCVTGEHLQGSTIVSVISNRTLSQVREEGTINERDFDNSTTLPHAAVLFADLSLTENTTYVDWQVKPGQAIFAFAFEHSTLSSDGTTWANTLVNDIILVPTVDLQYLVTGQHSMVGLREILLRVSLLDLETNTNIFDNSQQSNVTLDEILTVGKKGGDGPNSLVGSQSGTLFAGNRYSLTVQAFISENRSYPGDASARGSVTLKLTDSGEIPEPSTLVIWSVMGGIGLVATRWRRKRKAA